MSTKTKNVTTPLLYIDVSVWHVSVQLNRLGNEGVDLGQDTNDGMATQKSPVNPRR